jgi:hypothetical protein
LKISSAATALLAAVLLSGCVSSAWEKTESVPGGRLYVPKTYAPLLPGSIYPNKNLPVPTKNRPAIVVACPPKGDCREKEILDQAAQRGIVVLVARGAETAIAPRQEVDLTRTGTLIVTPTALKVQAAPPTRAGAPHSSRSKQNSLLAALLSDEPLEASDGMVLKLYSPNKEGLLPNEAFRDAVEWLAGELNAR